MDRMLTVSHVSKKYPGFSLEDVSFELPSGSIMGLVGENGAGKTTTLKLILNELRRDQGEITVFGMDNRKQEQQIKEQLGVVFDESRKHEVMSRCHFGFNLMKPDVCVGLTMKSVDYFRHDLPILNNIPADTAELVDREQVGLTVGEDTAARVAAMTVEDCLRMRKNVRRVFDENFDLPVVQARYAALLQGIV